jgi:hypothetical protein
MKLKMLYENLKKEYDKDKHENLEAIAEIAGAYIIKKDRDEFYSNNPRAWMTDDPNLKDERGNIIAKWYLVDLGESGPRPEPEAWWAHEKYRLGDPHRKNDFYIKSLQVNPPDPIYDRGLGGFQFYPKDFWKQEGIKFGFGNDTISF